MGKRIGSESNPSYPVKGVLLSTKRVQSLSVKQRKALLMSIPVESLVRILPVAHSVQVINCAYFRGYKHPDQYKYQWDFLGLSWQPVNHGLNANF